MSKHIPPRPKPFDKSILRSLTKDYTKGRVGGIDYENDDIKIFLGLLLFLIITNVIIFAVATGIDKSMIY